MTKNIFEELPARKHSPAAATPAAKKETGEGGLKREFAKQFTISVIVPEERKLIKSSIRTIYAK